MELPKAVKVSLFRKDNSHINIGDLRIIKSGSKVWSIDNQMNLSLCEDTIVRVNQKVIGDTIVFVSPMSEVFNMPGQIPGVVEQGKDEWSLDYDSTEPYEIPNPYGFDLTYENDEDE